MSKYKYYIWSAINKFGTEILSFVGNVLIARILMPEDYGLIAMLSIFINIAMGFSDSGFNDGLIRKVNADRKDFGTIATFNVSVATFIYLILFFCAPAIASFFVQPKLIDITRVLGISIILKAITLSGFVQLNKELRFKESTFINICCSICSIAVTYSLALLGFSYWALAFQPIAVAGFNIFFLLIIARWRPYFCFCWDRFKPLFSYSSNLLVSYLVGMIGDNLYGFIIGKFYVPASLGYYNQAHKMQTVPTNGLNSIILTTSYPIIAKESEVSKRRMMYISIFKKFNFLHSLLVFSLICVSDFVFYYIFGEKWLPSSPLFELLLILSLAFPMKTVNANIVKLAGQSNIYRNLTILRTFLQTVSLIICAPISVEAILIGQIFAAFISVSIDMYVCGKTIDWGWLQQYKVWIKIIWIPIFSFIISSLISVFILEHILLKALIKFVCFSVCFIALCQITHSETFVYFKSILSNSSFKDK